MGLVEPNTDQSGLKPKLGWWPIPLALSILGLLVSFKFLRDQMGRGLVPTMLIRFFGSAWTCWCSQII